MSTGAREMYIAQTGSQQGEMECDFGVAVTQSKTRRSFIMVGRKDSSGVTIDSNIPLTYYYAAISIFDRSNSHGCRNHGTSKHHSTRSSEDRLEQAPRYFAEKEGNTGNLWNPGFFNHVPFIGVLALLVVPLCVAADAIILYKSNGQEVSTWKVSPAVLLAILSAVANSCLQFAHSEGVTIAWWRKALHGGTLYDLSRYWESGDSLRAASTPGRGFNLIALATILTSAVVIDGPLLQRVSITISVPVQKAVNVTAPIAQSYHMDPLDLVRYWSQ